MTNRFSQMPATQVFDYFTPSTLVALIVELYDGGDVSSDAALLIDVVSAALYRNCGTAEAADMLTAAGVFLN